MKTMRMVSVAGVVLVGAAGIFFGSNFISRAQMQSISGSAALPVSQGDSVVQVIADSENLPLVSPEQLPKVGTFWTVGGNGLCPVPYPCPPSDPNATFYAIGPKGVFLVDITGGAAPQPTGRQAVLGVSSSTLVQAETDSLLNLIAQQQAVQMNAMMSASGMISPMDVPSPGGGGDSGGAGADFSSSYTAPNYGTNLWIRNDGMASGNVVGIVSNSTADVLYEIQSLTNLSQNNWNSEGFISGSELTNWTALSVGANGRAQLYLRIRSWADNTGTGIPDWWWLQFFGQITNVDPYAPDPAGDGYNNLQKFQMGLNPASFTNPPTPTGFYPYVDSTGTNVLLSWNPSPGPVQHYALGRYDYSRQTGWVFTSLGQVNGNVTSFEDVGGYNPASGFAPLYQLYAIYPGGSSPSVTSYVNWSPPASPTYNYNLRLTACLVRNATGRWQVMFSGFPTNSPQTINLIWTSGSGNTTQNISTTNLINGVYPIADTNVVNLLGDSLSAQLFGPAGQPGQVAQAGTLTSDAPYFVDGRVHLKQVLSFLLSGALGSSTYGGYDGNYTYNWSTNFEEIGFLHRDSYYWSGEGGSWIALDDLRPFNVNYVFRNNILDTNNPGPFNFTWQTNFNPIPAPPVLTNVQPYLIWQGLDPNRLSGVGATVQSVQIGSYVYSNYLSLQGTPFFNCYGLPALNGEVVYGTTDVPINPGGNLIWVTSASSSYYSRFQAPILTNAGYYFAPLINPNADAMSLPSVDAQPFPTPLNNNFVVTNQTPLIVGSVGQPMILGGWAKYSIKNGNPNKFAYLGQYFMTNAFLLNTNGTATTNVAGILSPYGDFFPLRAGMSALATMPDIDTGQQGTGIVRVISLNADANHDGTMDFSYFGPDQTSPSRPFRFWANDDQDAGDDYGTGVPGLTAPQADASCPAGDYYVPNPASGFNFQAFYQVHGRRDLVDFFPVYINIGSLFQSNALSAGISFTDTNWQFVLSQADGALRFVYTDLTPTNYMNFLRDTNESGKLANATAWPVNDINYNPIALSQSFVAGIATNNQGIILVDVATSTTQPLVLTIYHGTNQIAQTQLYLSISGVEQMFRNKNLLLYPDSSAQTDRLNDWNVPNEPDTTAKNFVFLHGYNVNPYQARGVAADMFKRMYWSGSHAKFYSVVWSGYDSQVANSVTINYHTNEVHACVTAPAFASFLAALTNGPTTVAAHSLGNMVVLSAMNDYNVQSIGTYFMIDAAIPLESIQGNSIQDSHLYYPDWEAYADKLNASHWGHLWPTNDARSALTWSNRFENLQNAEVYDFYSSGEEVLREYTGGYPPSEVGGAIDQVTYYLENELQLLGKPVGSYVWAWQEMLKGRGKYDGLLGSTHGGWKFNTNAPYAYITNGVITQIPDSQATLIPPSQLQTNAFFDVTSPQFGNADLALFGSSGSSYAQANRNRILSDAIPELTLPVGANPITKLPPDNNLDMNATTFKNGWPADRASDQGNWHHSDFHQVAYTFTYKLFDDLVTFGGLQ